VAPIVGDFVQEGLASWWAPALAFAAGVVSFASPCVFPLVPGYLSFVSGGQVEQERRPLVPILLFIGGFAAVFTAIGAFTGTLGRFLRNPTVVRASGLIVIAFGTLMLLYALRVGWPGLYAEKRPLLQRVKPGRAWAFPLGVAFGLGWTPCVGPVLAGILILAANQGGSAKGGFLLFMYSAGLGLPFLVIGLGIRWLVGALDFFKRNYHWITGIAGAIMIVVGVLIVTDLWTQVLAPVRSLVNSFQPPI
jgi:cytochrome c-type biogenesis protein